MSTEKKTPEEALASNLSFYRKSAGLTQQDIADRFNYSDKAVSKWERGESFPDVFVLRQLAEFYDITLNDFFKDKPKKYFPAYHKKHIIISLLSVGLVWLVAIVLYVLFTIVFTGLSINVDGFWLVYIAAIPASCILGIIFSSIWGKPEMTLGFISALLWTATLTVYLPLHLYVNFSEIDLLWLIPVPLQIMAILWYYLKTPMHLKVKKYFSSKSDKK